jgi:hypothetical protein
MIATPHSPRSLLRHSGCQIVCAWCDQVMRTLEPEHAFSTPSHGICPPCALEHFGIRLLPERQAPEEVPLEQREEAYCGRLDKDHQDE